jgi:hypothetical protein
LRQAGFQPVLPVTAFFRTCQAEYSAMPLTLEISHANLARAVKGCIAKIRRICAFTTERAFSTEGPGKGFFCLAILCYLPGDETCREIHFRFPGARLAGLALAQGRRREDGVTAVHLRPRTDADRAGARKRAREDDNKLVELNERLRILATGHYRWPGSSCRRA